MPTRCACDGMGAINYRFALSNPTLVSALSQKIIFQRQLPDLGVHRLDVHREAAAPPFAKTSAARTLSCRLQSVI